MENQDIISPCISICKTDPVSGYCYGCARTNEEKKNWIDKTTKNDWKKNNLKEIHNRMSGWQLETFKESYSNKVETGFSIFKKNLIKNNTEK